MIKYLKDNNYPITQQNLELAAKRFVLDDCNDCKYLEKSVEVVNHTELENVDDKDLSVYINYKILEQLADIKNILLNMDNKDTEMEYQVVNVGINVGVCEFSNLLNSYTEQGWRISKIYTTAADFPDLPRRDCVFVVFERFK